MDKIFRWIIVISTLLFIIAWLLPYYDYLWLSDEQLDLLSYDGSGSSIPSSPLIYWGWFFTWLTISVCLFFFVPIARKVFVIV